MMRTQGTLFVLSAPSGAGKDTVLTAVKQLDDCLTEAISATTRTPRSGEVEGKDYYFLNRAAFEQRIEEDAFVEWAEVHGNLYGTLRSELERCLAAGKLVMLEIDVQGMRSVKAMYPDAVTIFLMPPSLEELERRLRFRGKDSDEVIALRLRNAETEMASKDEFDHIVINDELEQAATDLLAILRGTGSRENQAV